MTTESLSVNWSSVRSLGPTFSPMPRMMAPMMSTVATSHRLRAPVRIWSLNSSPNTPMGIVPTMTYQPIRYSRSRRVLSNRPRKNATRMRQMSFAKYSSTADDFDPAHATPDFSYASAASRSWRRLSSVLPAWMATDSVVAPASA